MRMFGFGAFGESPFGAIPDRVRRQFTDGAQKASIVLSGLIVPEKKTFEGVLVQSTGSIWNEIIRQLGDDWAIAFQISPEKWEEIVAGAFKADGYDEVILTPRSGDHGRDVIAIKNGVGSVKILGSVKAYGAGKLVRYDDVRALAGVLSTDLKASKGIIATTSDFPANIETEASIAPLLPTRLELLNGKRLQEWLVQLGKRHK